MHVTTAPEGPERGRAHARLHSDLETLGRLDPERPSASERLVEVLGPELAQKLVFGLTSGGRRFAEIRAA